MTDATWSSIITKVSLVKEIPFTQKRSAGRKGSCMMSKNLEISVLLDYYGQMLTEKQLEVSQLYYNEDLSLAEIAQFAQITRQGVRDSLKRAETTLFDMENRLGLVKKFREHQGKLDAITDYAKEIAFEAERCSCGDKICKDARKIMELTQQIEE